MSNKSKIGKYNVYGGIFARKENALSCCRQKKSCKGNMGAGGYFLCLIVALVLTSSIVDAASQNASDVAGEQKITSGSVVSDTDLTDPIGQQNGVLESRDAIGGPLKDTSAICSCINSKNNMGDYREFQKFMDSENPIVYFDERVTNFNNVWNDVWREICQK